MRLPDWSADRWLFIFDATVLTSVGGMAFGGSASHVYNLALRNGQEGFGAISVTALAEILFAYSGLEVRRRSGFSKGVPIFWLLLTAAFIVWANLESTTVHTYTGYIIAVAPAVVFAGVATTAETRQWGSGKAKPETIVPPSPVNSSDPVLRSKVRAVHTGKSADTPTVAAVARRRAVTEPTGRPVTPRGERQDALRAAGREYLASLATETPMGRQEVAQRLGVSPQRAGVLMTRWTEKPELLDV